MKKDVMAKYRQNINALDIKIAKLLAKRFAVANDIGAYKKENGIPVFDAAREASVLASVRENGGAFSEEVCEVYQTVLTVSKSLQEEKA